MDVIFAETDDPKGPFHPFHTALIFPDFVSDLLDQATAGVWSSDCCQGADIFVSIKKRDRCSGVHSGERVSDQVHFAKVESCTLFFQVD